MESNAKKPALKIVAFVSPMENFSSAPNHKSAFLSAFSFSASLIIT